MSDFSPSAGPGTWIVSRSGGAPTPSPSPNPHGTTMRNMSFSKPFQCGICYDFLSHSVDELDDHILKHKRELADRLHNQAQTEAARREVVHMNQNHQQMVFFADGTQVGTQVQGFEYQGQSCSAQGQQFQEYRPHIAECKSASKYYTQHPALLSHNAREQTAPGTMTEMYQNECAGRSDGHVVSVSLQHDDFTESLVKRGRFETHVFDREEQHHRHAARPDLNEENTADADPSTDHMKNESEYGPVSFSEAQQSDTMSFHELQPIKSTSSSTAQISDRGAANAGVECFVPARDEAAHEQQESNGADSSTMHEHGAKHSDIQSSRDSEGNDIDTEPTSPTEDSSKGLENLGEGNARSDNESVKSHEDHSNKSSGLEGGHSGRAPRIRRSARMQTNRR